MLELLMFFNFFCLDEVVDPLFGDCLAMFYCINILDVLFY